MLEILKAQEFNEKIPAGLPPGTPVAHKTGDITAIHHDAAIVFPPGEKPYILVVLTGGDPGRGKANRVIAEVSRAVWENRGVVPAVLHRLRDRERGPALRDLSVPVAVRTGGPTAAAPPISPSGPSAGYATPCRRQSAASFG